MVYFLPGLVRSKCRLPSSSRWVRQGMVQPKSPRASVTSFDSSRVSSLSMTFRSGEPVVLLGAGILVACGILFFGRVLLGGVDEVNGVDEVGGAPGGPTTGQAPGSQSPRQALSPRDA